MPPARRSVCGAGLHDLTDPANVGFYKRKCGHTTRYCLPCSHRRSQEHRRRERKAALELAPVVRRPRRGGGLGILQAVADGETADEAAEQLALTRDAVHGCLVRLRRRYGVASTAAAVAVALATGDISPVRGQPLPPRNNTTRNHARSLLRLLRGERAPRGHGAAYERMLDDLYAFSEPHAVSVLWKARIITADDVRPLLEEAA
ncbi:hypothetical protein [Streptomyces sp. WAC 01529]|uniref:hypothetical protein n=1 Tax=Streptomyces sp. WAC 01529 TaxID=2203205 RepID=UPI000F7442A0|nr:hypothetical protein [Streptomyces sp. WAC 01529]